ncbi:MAG: nickel pincer cofactor biosynthesis protein LarC [Armatimonadetes bacterium]|nr:nickel pincer cofactor biosynthesis protein LarC [Armatimonadota bacterium]
MIAYLDCFSGISGDMLLGALVDVGLAIEDLRADLAKLPLEGYEVTAKRVVKRSLSGTQVSVKTKHEHGHRGLSDILEIINGSKLPPEVTLRARRIFERLAEAEARVHGRSVEEVHFHEVGAVDAIVDIVGACCGLHRLGLEKVYASALPLGGGWVESAHGRLPVPAPATVELLHGVPSYGGPVEEELVTPTGAAIVTTIASEFGTMPAMTVRAVGWGAGQKELAHPNLLRVFLGDPTAQPLEQQLSLIETNVDNMNPELFGHTMERLLEAGALDVFYTPIVMKKSRPATLVSVLAEPSLVGMLSELLFRETTTLGVRVTEVSRRCLEREWTEVETAWGKVRVKIGRLNGEVVNIAPEYEDCARLARENDIPAKAVYEAAREAAGESSA